MASYIMYQKDFGAALKDLWERVFRDGDYPWGYEKEWVPEEQRRPRPETMDELYADQWLQESRTHSILDIFHVLGRGR
ncbi:hypothetical protein [Peterkaempfera sp. SMS 1(5)a]|uniref:hypothetical protein n=1 Tax=Peterkaempfera podocarpi TaxID=3232308 RepID=UPI00366D5424